MKDYGIFMLDPEGYVLTWNEGASRLKGYTESEIVGQPFPVFTLRPISPTTVRKRLCESPAPKANSKTKDGACGATVRDSGPAS